MIPAPSLHRASTDALIHVHASMHHAQLSLEVRDGGLEGSVWFVGQGPHDSGGPVLVPLNELVHHLEVVLQSLVPKVLHTACREEETHSTVEPL